MAHTHGGTDAAASPLAGLRPGDHIVFLYKTEAEHRALLTAFLRQGLARGEKVVYIADTHEVDTLLGYLQEGGVNPDPYLARGQLVFLTPQETYLEGGSFDPQRMIARLEAMAQEALAKGYSALRVTGEMTWALQGALGANRLLEYEARLEEFFQKGTCIGLCQYDRRRFDAETLLEIAWVHPLVAFGEDVRVSASLAGRMEAEEGLAREEDRWRALARVTRFLASSLEPGEVLARIVSVAREVAGADYAAVALVDEEGRVEESTTNLPGVPALTGAIRGEGGFTAWIVRTGQTLIVDDVDPEGRITPYPGEGAPETTNPVVAAAGVRSAVGLPLVARDRVLGVLYFYSLRPGALREAVPLLRGFADAAATALENARLYREARDELARRRQVEEHLRASEARFRAIVEQSVSGLVLTDERGLVVEWNPALEEMTGLPRSAVVGRPIWEVHAGMAADRPRAEAVAKGVQALVEAFFRTGDAAWLHQRMERTVRRPDGTGRVLSAEYFPVRVGERLYLGGFFQDVTERHEAERARRESEALYRALAESSEDMIVLLDRDGRILYANATTVRELGRPLEEVLGRPVAEFLPLAAPQEPLAHMREVFDRGEPVRLDHQFALGEKVWLNTWLVPIRDADGQVYGALNVYRDITEQERARGELVRLSAFHESILQSMAEGVAVQDPEGRFTFVNRAAAEMLGYAPQELLGQHWTKVTAPEHHARVRAADERRARGESDRYELDLIRRDGQRITVSMHGSPRYEGGQFVGTLAVFEDVTERKRLEEQLQQAVKMEAIGRLAGGVAHDFNNLLTAIGGYAHLLRESLGKDDPRRKDAEEILAATDRASSLTRQLLAFSRRQILRPEVLNLNTVVADMEKMLRRLIGEDIALVTALAEDLGHVEADRSQVEQVILNLAVNAREAMPRGGTLTIETANVFLDEAYARRHLDVKPGPYVLLAVTDTGVGMDAEILSHLFEPFFTTKETGTGLGLSTVYGIVKQSGGHIWVYSEPGQGSTFPAPGG
ncbi:MAG: PAS domain S-box protein [Anaerolineae bacterium]